MFIQLHSLTGNTPIWVNPASIALITFSEGRTDLLLANATLNGESLALQVIESEAEVRTLIEHCTEFDAVIVLPAYTDD